MQGLRRFFLAHKTLVLSLGFLVLFSVTVSYATPPVAPYSAGSTLDPQCAPGEANCTVNAPVSVSGNSGGQTINGGTQAGENLTLSSTVNSTKGKIVFGNSAYDEAANRLGIGTTTPLGKLSVVSDDLDGITSAYSFGSYDAFGDSITAGTGATVPANKYVSLIGTALSVTPTDQGVGGDQAADQESEIYQTTVNSTGSQLFTYMVGTNDMAHYFANADQLANYQSFMLASAAWLGIPANKKITAQSGTPTYSGSWSNSTYYGGSIGKYSTTNGDTATFTVSGTVAYVAYTMLDSNAGQFSITVDGVSKGTYSNYGKNNSVISTQNGKTYGSGLARIAGLSSGSHTVVLTVTSATDPNNKVFFDWAAGNEGVTVDGGPLVIQGGVPNKNSYLVPIYSSLVIANVSMLHGDGLNIYYADTTNAINISTDLIGDVTHPNDLGHSHLAQAFLSAINNRFTTSQSTVAVTSSAGTGQFVVSSGGYVGIGTSDPTSPFTLQAPSDAFDSATSSALLPLVTVNASNGTKAFEIRVAGGANTMAFGVGAGSSLTTGASNNFFGFQSGYSTTTGGYNNFLGVSTGYNNTTGVGNNFLGQSAGYTNTTGSYSNFLGYQAGYSTTTGQSNNFIGFRTGYFNTTGLQNNFLGETAGYSNTTGGYNNFLGLQSGYLNTTGGFNNFLGFQSGYSNTSGVNNTFVGYKAGYSNTTGGKNIIIGQYGDVASGTVSGQLNIGNVLFGTGLYQSNTLSAAPVSGGAIGIGTNAPTHTLTLGSISTGFAAYNTADQTTNYERVLQAWNGNTFSITSQAGGTGIARGISLANTVGSLTLRNAQDVTGLLYANGTLTVAGATLNATAGTLSAASGSQSVTAINPTISQSGTAGYRALFISPYEQATGSGNKYLIDAGTNTALNGSGTHTSKFIVDDAGNVGIKNTTLTYSLNVGSASVSGIVARFQNSTGTCDINPTGTALSCSSDMTLKKNIDLLSDGSSWSFNGNITADNQSVLAKLLALTPVNYNWNSESDGDAKHTGFIAQDVRQVFPDLVSEDSATHLLSLNYMGLIPYTVEAIKEMNLNITDIANLNRDNTWRTAFIDWFASSTNGIENFFSKKVTTDQLCVKDANGETCLNRSQIDQVLQQHSSSGTITVVNDPSGETETSTSTDETVTEQPTDQSPTITEEPAETTQESDSTVAPDEQPSVPSEGGTSTPTEVQ
jgi:hypothetical protein